jgi:hypothetical protein
VVILAIGLHQRSHILPELLQRRSSNEPPTIVDRMDFQIWSQGKGIGKRNQAVFEIGRRHFNHIELSDGTTLVITEECKGRPEPCSEGRADVWWIGTDNCKLTVVDLQVLLQFEEAPHLARAFRSPIAAVEAHDQRKTTGQFRQGDGLMPMIRKR